MGPGVAWHASDARYGIDQVRAELEAAVYDPNDESDPALLVRKLPARESALVCWVCDVMLAVCSREAQNKMGAKAIATVRNRHARTHVTGMRATATVHNRNVRMWVTGM